jgi:tetratricopeptide (TPR) repeat protein
MAGMFWSLRAPPGRAPSGALLLAALFLAYAAGVVAFFVASRYRLPILPILAVFAGTALARAGAALGARRVRELLLPSAAAVVFLVVANAGLPAMPRAFSSDTYSDMGTSHFERGRLDEAASWYERALELDPANAEAAHNLGAIWLKRGRTEQAEPLFRRVLASWPEDAKALVNLGNVFLQRGEPYRAGRYYLEVARRDPADPDAPRNLRLAEETALRLERERMSADAQAFLEQLERLLAREPENEFLRERLRALRAGAMPAVR